MAASIGCQVSINGVSPIADFVISEATSFPINRPAVAPDANAVAPAATSVAVLATPVTASTAVLDPEGYN